MKELWGYTSDVESRGEVLNGIFVTKDSVNDSEILDMFPSLGEQVKEEDLKEYTISDLLWMLLNAFFDGGLQWADFRELVNTKVCDMTNDDFEEFTSIVNSWEKGLIRFTRT